MSAVIEATRRKMCSIQKSGRNYLPTNVSQLQNYKIKVIKDVFRIKIKLRYDHFITLR